MSDVNQPTDPVKTETTSSLSVRLPDSLIERAEEIASASKVISKLDVVRLSIEKGMPLVAEMFGTPAAAADETPAKSKP